MCSFPVLNNWSPSQNVEAQIWKEVFLSVEGLSGDSLHSPLVQTLFDVSLNPFGGGLEKWLRDGRRSDWAVQVPWTEVIN